MDAFQSEDGKGINELFNENSPYFSKKIFENSNNWHQHSGWFVPWSKDRKLLEQVRVDVVNDAAGMFLARLQHNQIIREAGGATLDTVSKDYLSQEFEDLHRRNKELLMAVLTPEVQKRIGLQNAK